MASAAIGTLAVTGLLVAGLALYLLMIVANLRKISRSLDTVYGAVAGIAGQVNPAPAVVGAIAADVGAMQGALHGLIDLATSAPPPAAATPAPVAAAPVAAAPPAASASAPRRPLRAARPGGRPNLPPPVHRRP